MQEYETRAMAPLIYLDWMSRSPLVRKLYGTKSSTQSSPKLSHDNRDIEGEENLPYEEQVELLNKRIAAIHECMDVFERYYPLFSTISRKIHAPPFFLPHPIYPYP